MTDKEKIGIIGSEMVSTFNLDISPDTPIYVGLSNRTHMENEHRSTYLSYADKMSDIISTPDYVGINPKDNSLEYYKKFNDEVIHIKIAVRGTKNNVFFARSMYSVNDHTINSYISKNRLKPV